MESPDEGAACARVTTSAATWELPTGFPSGSLEALTDVDGDDPSWALLLPGYSVTIVASGPVCEVRITPVIPQHGRRLKGRFGPDGRL